MKKYILAVAALAALAVPTVAVAAISNQYGGTIADGQATLVSDGVTPYSFISFNDLNGQPLANLTELSADVVSATSWGGGSPRFQVRVSPTQSIFVYLGELPNLNTGSTGPTGNLLNDGVRVDSSQLGGSFYGTWADALAAAGGNATISNISLVVDGGWSGAQTFVFDAVSINGTVNGFGPMLASKEDCKNGGWQLHGFKNQGACVSSLMATS